MQTPKLPLNAGAKKQGKLAYTGLHVPKARLFPAPKVMHSQVLYGVCIRMDPWFIAIPGKIIGI